ncbi:hypothetical protein [Pseudomonas fluorescens]|uniref:DUF560 domain-containing protein n=1 Tax=Pseudomonas fluorescens TaxID=294 RepID=A0A5E7CW34_PSEFL|nr:hypothetical protein [Pseudomonas fluorescens]VVN99733.1 hypothetical protein PS691_02532 [Pseudomonas fluorescens]
MLLLRTTGIATAILSLPYSGMAYAATWQSAIALPTTVEYDSNPLLLTSGEKGVTRTIIAPDYSLVGTSGQDEFQFGLGLNVVRSSDTSIVSDREDPRLKLGWQRETETGGFGLTARYEESSTLSTAVQETGVVAPDGTQKLYSLGANWRSALSERSTLVNETDYTHVTYDIDSLINYDELATRFSWNYAWSERVELFTRFGVRRYEPEGSAVASSNSYTPTVGLNVQLSEKLKGTVYAGLNQVSGTDSDPTGQGGFALQYTGERFDASIDAGRSTVASGDGGFVEVDSLRGTWSYSIDETRRTGFDAAWQDSKGQTPNTLRNLGAWFSQELSPFWNARLSYTYKERQQDGLPDASANVVGLTLIYSYPGL